MSGADPSAPVRLAETPDWIYLLREFEALYRHGSAGGSAAIRSHRKRVREALSAVIADAPEVVARPGADLPVTAHLPRALDLGERAAMQGMARALRGVSGRLCWEHGYARMPRALARNYAEEWGPEAIT